jgi:hypothetical protein
LLIIGKILLVIAIMIVGMEIRQARSKQVKQKARKEAS